MPEHYLKDELYALIKKDNSIFDFIQNSALDGLWYWDLENFEDEWMNERFWEVLGYDAAQKEHKASSWMGIINLDDLALAKEKVAMHLADPNYPYDQVIRYRHANGSTVWIRCRGLAIRNAEGIPIRMLGAHNDISEFKNQQEFLERCNTEAKIGYWEVDLRNNKPKWSKETCIIHGVPDDYDPQFEAAVNFFLEQDREIMYKAFAAAVEKQEPYTLELRIRKQTGDVIWVRAMGIPDFSNGECVRVYGTIQDINERKRAQLKEEELLKFTQHQNDRLRNFAHIVSHNLRSHVSGFKGILDILKEDIPEGVDTEYVKLLESGVDNFQSTLQDLTEVVKINLNSGLDKESIHLWEVVNRNFKSVYSLARKSGVELINEVDESIKIDAVPAYINSIILNFTTNAIKYKSDQRASFFKVTCCNESAKDFLKICFEDNGLGIDLERHKEKLFGIYKTFHRHPDARGVGLFITKNQIETMGGTISVESTLGMGTTFMVELPK